MPKTFGSALAAIRDYLVEEESGFVELKGDLGVFCDRTKTDGKKFSRFSF